MFVSKRFKIETKSNSNQPQIYPIDKMHWKGPKSWPKEMCDYATHPRTQSASSFIAPAPDREPQEAPEGPRKLQEGPGSIRRPHKTSEPPGRPGKATGGSRKGPEGAGRTQEASKPGKLKVFWARGVPKLVNSNVLDRGARNTIKVLGPLSVRNLEMDR